MAGIRIGGLASGMDIDTLVGDLMKAERMPLDKLKQKKQALEWQRDDYRSMNTLLLNFRTELTNMKLTTQYRARSVTSTNESRISATASSAASASSYSIKSVEKLASAATRITNTALSANTASKIDASKSLISQQDKLNPTAVGTSPGFTWSEDGVIGNATIVSDGTAGAKITLNANEKIATTKLDQMSVKVNGTSYKIVSGAPAAGKNEVQLAEDGTLTFSGPIAKDSSIKVSYIADQKVETNKLTAATSEWQLGKGGLTMDFSLKVGDVAYTIDGTQDENGHRLVNNGQYIGSINLETGKVKFDAEQAADTELTATYKQKYSSFNITTQTSKGEVSENFLVEGTESLNQVVNRVNSSNAGVSMFYDSFSDKISLTRKETGDFLAGTGNEISATGLFAESLLKFADSNESGGENAVFTINGLRTERNSNTFEMNGVTFTLKQTFTESEAPPVSLSVNNDTTKVYDNIKSFIDKYNELIDKISKKSSEEYYRDYKPLTDEQKEQLSDKQQEQWEEKAKSGLLRRDPILAQVLNGMRSNFSTPVKNSEVSPLFSQLASIGISTTANYLEGGKLQIDEAKLKKAIEQDPQSVENLFRGTGATSAEQGIAHRLTDTINAAMDKLKAKAGNTFSTNSQFLLGRQLTNVTSQISTFENRLTKVEDRYWRQFTAMEKAIQRSNEQATYLMQQFS
ncbi:flagellar filament capping protein FliD [Mesobacillus foraminis]|uniref:flagellar filament capping protein FliD n=1 Tax=Mesobacillus foraminis TaxID=279826 RepID=UPI001BEC8E30|nr:flagellar filament capping protein FliD [Mesobacillus foraminis]MBT2757195.1 flagellar filament capping protein FliD [Mesobacillus foraminis]